MGALFSNCALFWAHRKARSRGTRCIAILQETGVHLSAMQSKYQQQLDDVDEAIAVGRALPHERPHEKQARRDRLVELLRKRKMLRHYLSVCRRRNDQMLAKTMAIEQLEVTSMQLQAIKGTAEAFESFSKKTGGVESIEDAADKLTEHIETLADIDNIIKDTLPLGFDDSDDDELLAELATFDGGIPDQKPVASAPSIDVSVQDLGDMPKVPQTVPSSGASTLNDILDKEPIAL